MIYVWRGEVVVAGTPLVGGSSLIVEQGAPLAASAGANGATLVIFSTRRTPRAAGCAANVHLLPSAQVPRFAAATAGGTSGEMHADGSCPTYAGWLHANSFPPRGEATEAEAERGIHAHAEDEIILVTAGQMRLGRRLYPAGTALKVSAGTFYGFTAGPVGLDFINFRAGPPQAIRFKNGATMDEVGYWRDRVMPPRYITLSPV